MYPQLALGFIKVLIFHFGTEILFDLQKFHVLLCYSALK